MRLRPPNSRCRFTVPTRHHRPCTDIHTDTLIHTHTRTRSRPPTSMHRQRRPMIRAEEMRDGGPAADSKAIAADEDYRQYDSTSPAG
jgi:hypothetical protein